MKGENFETLCVREMFSLFYYGRTMLVVTKFLSLFDLLFKIHKLLV